MRYAALVGLVTAVLAAPALGQANQEPATTSPADPTAQEGVLRVRFDCENGEEAEMRFFTQQGLAILAYHGKTVELRQQRSGSGFIYGSGPCVVRGKGRDISIETDRMAPVKCTAQ